MKRKHNGGYSLIEVLIAMAVLGIITVPTTSALLTAHRMNVKAEQMLEAQLDVSSAVESLMATGVNKATNYDTELVNIEVEDVSGVTAYYKVTVNSQIENVKDVSVTTYIRKAPINGGG